MNNNSINVNSLEKAFSNGLLYLKNVSERSVIPSSMDIENLKVFEEKFNNVGVEEDTVIDMLHTYGSPATLAQMGGRYFGFVNGGALPAGLSARILSDFWDQNAALQVMSPIISKLESVVEKWLVEIFRLPEGSAAGYVSGTSMSIFCGLASARWRIYNNIGWDINKKGLNQAPPIKIITGDHAHAAVVRAIALLGLGTDNVVRIPCDDQGRIIAEEIPSLDHRSILILQAGNVNSGSFDPFDKICHKAKEEGAWIHVDGAFGLWAAGSNHFEQLSKEMNLADSWSCDAHKTLNTPYDNGLVLCRDREALTSALQSSGSYLIKGELRDGMMYTPEMSRRGRIVELWATLKYLGKEGLDKLVRQLHERAQQFAIELSQGGFQILNNVVFNQVLVACDTDEMTDTVLKRVQGSGVCWCGGSLWFGRKVIRISVCSWMTTTDDITMSVNAFIKAKNTEVNKI